MAIKRFNTNKIKNNGNRFRSITVKHTNYENNFINTTKDMRWFCYFRLYGPTNTYFDRLCPMNDIQKIK